GIRDLIVTGVQTCALPIFAIVEPDDHPDRDHVLADRIDERPAELAELLPRAQRPAHRVNHAIERLSDTPDLLDAERPHLRMLARSEERRVGKEGGARMWRE